MKEIADLIFEADVSVSSLELRAHIAKLLDSSAESYTNEKMKMLIRDLYPPHPSQTSTQSNTSRL